MRLVAFDAATGRSCGSAASLDRSSRIVAAEGPLVVAGLTRAGDQSALHVWTPRPGRTWDQFQVNAAQRSSSAASSS